MRHEWPRVRLGEVLSQVRRSVAVNPTSLYPLLGVRLDGAGPFLREEKTGAELSAANLFEVKENDFIYSRLFAWRGAFGVIPAAFDGCFVSNEFPTFVSNSDMLDPAFLTYWFRLSDVLIGVANDCSGSTPLTRNRYNERFFVDLEIPLPSLAEQRRIVAKIERLAGKMAEVMELRQHALLEAEAFWRRAARRLLGDATQCEMVSIGALCSKIIDCLHSNPVFSDDGVPTIRSPDVGWGKLRLDTARRTSEEEYRRRVRRGEPEPGDIILVREGGGTGKAGLVEQGDRLSLGQRVMQLRPNRDKILPRFLLHYWLSPLIQEDQIAERMKGSASPHLNIGETRQFHVMLPPISQQRRIVAYLDGLQAKVDRLKALQAGTRAELDALLPSILDRAFKGEL